MIAKHLIDNFDTKIFKYFNPINTQKWKLKYETSIKDIAHDEPWLTLIAFYSIFGNQATYTQKTLSAINKVLNGSGLKNKIDFTEIDRVQVEIKFPEILSYRDYLKEQFKNADFHLYPDRREKIKTKLTKKIASYEGNTNLDLIIEGISNGKKTTCFIEAKFLSDISYQITYNPVRDQIIRNIDCGIDYVQSKTFIDKYSNFYFFLLTPKIFKPYLSNSSKSVLNKLGADRSRLYCYKMKEYTEDFSKIKESLPHRDLNDNDWKTISENIGWLTFEDFYKSSMEFSTFENQFEADMIKNFFEERNLI
ncbi:hypothetical protein MASR1M45_02670 [Candidatus Kapaibacterium sp.]